MKKILLLLAVLFPLILQAQTIPEHPTKAEGAAAVTGDYLSASGAVRRDDPVVPGVAAGSWTKLVISALSGLWVEPIHHSKTVCTTPTVTANSAYTSGNSVGGALTFASLFRAGIKSGTLATVRVLDKAVQGMNYDFIPLSAALTGGTVADKTAVAIADADLAAGFTLPVAQVVTHRAFADSGMEQFTGGIPLVSTDTSLRGILIVNGTPTYASTSDVTICVTVWQD